ncbi:nucleotide exchange factor GrpE [Candidatus Uhrbacteria bacterium]|nr:nucleotide exchange factor GrpE [Candidatus Uhrbacteria bacterium]
MLNGEDKKENEEGETLLDEEEAVDSVVDEEESATVTRDDETSDAPEEKIRALKTKIAQCEKDRQEYLRGWQRAKADFINARREEGEARKNIFSLAKEDVLLGMLPIADSFALAFKDREAWEHLPEGWRKGVERIHSQLLKVFEEHGLKEIVPLGEKFDSLLHEAVESVPVAHEAENDIILSVLQNGYVLCGKVLRPAKVKVGTYKE